VNALFSNGTANKAEALAYYGSREGSFR